MAKNLTDSKNVEDLDVKFDLRGKKLNVTVAQLWKYIIAFGSIMIAIGYSIYRIEDSFNEIKEVAIKIDTIDQKLDNCKEDLSYLKGKVEGSSKVDSGLSK